MIESQIRGRIDSSCFDGSASPAVWRLEYTLLLTVLLQGQDGTSGSAGAEKSGPSRAAYVVPTVKETALFDRGGSWAWTARDFTFIGRGSSGTRSGYRSHSLVLESGTSTALGVWA